MVVCKFFLQGECRFGENCRFEHQLNQEKSGNQPNQQFGNSQNQNKIINPKTGEEIDVITLINSVRNEVVSSERGRLWPLTCYAPFKEKPLYPGFVEMSYEEVRFEYIEAQKSNTLEQYNNKLQQLISENKGRYKALENPTKEHVNILRNIYTNNQSSQGNGGLKGLFSMNTSSVFGQQNSGGSASIFGQQNSSVFGQPSPSLNKGSIFGQQQNIFQQNNATQNDIFRQQQSGGNVFGQQTKASIFGQQNNGGTFGQQNNGPSSSNIFGKSNTSQVAGSIFGQQNNPTSIFGQQNATQNTTPFNQQNTNSIFRQQNTPSIFGQQNSAQNNLFSQQNTTPNTGSIFGQQNSGSIFGQPNANTQSSNSMFSNQNNVQGTTNIFGQQKSGSIFGQQNPVQGGGSIFGQQSSLQNSGSVFGHQNMAQNGNNIFQSTVQADSQQNSSSPFGAQKGNVFNTNSVFQQNQTQNVATQSSSIFANNLHQTNSISNQNPIFQVPSAQQAGSIFGLKPVDNIASAFNSGSGSKEVHPYAYSKLEDLSEEEIKWFNSDVFDIDNIPEKPPTYDMCY